MRREVIRRNPELDGKSWSADRDVADAVLRELEAILLDLRVPLEPTIALVAGWLGIEAGDRYRTHLIDDATTRNRILESLATGILGLARGGPVLVLVEDLHWADETTLALVARLIEKSQVAGGVLIAASFRQHFEHDWSGPHLLSLRLEGIPPDAVRRMADAVVGRRLPDDLVQFITKRTDGVPLFVELVTERWLATGLIPSAQEAESDQSSEIPPRLWGLLAESLDGLGDAKRVAQLGAVLGSEFSHEVLVELAGGPSEDIDGALKQLVQARMLTADGSALRRGYRFRHTLIRDVAYESLLHATRSELHLRAGELLRKHQPEMERTRPEVLARHFAEGGEVELALGLWRQAQNAAVAAYAWREAAGHWRAAHHVLEEHQPDSYRLARHLSRVRLLAAHDAIPWAEWRSLSERALAIYERLERSAIEAQQAAELPLLRQAQARESINIGTTHARSDRPELLDVEEARRHFERALELLEPDFGLDSAGVEPVALDARTAGDLAQAHAFISNAFRLAGKGSETLQAARRGLELLEPLGQAAPTFARSSTHMALGQALSESGSLDEGLRLLRVAWQETLALDPGTAYTVIGIAAETLVHLALDPLSALGWVSRERMLSRQAPVDARNLDLLAWLAMCETGALDPSTVELGDLSDLRFGSQTVSAAALLLLRRGEFALAREQLEANAQLAYAAGAVFNVGCAQYFLSRVEAAESKLDAAVHRLESATRLVHESSEVWEAVCRQELAILHARIGQGDEAGAQLEAALELLPGAAEWRGRSGRFALAEGAVRARRGDTDGANAAFERAARVFSRYRLYWHDVELAELHSAVTARAARAAV
jgi:tetratricopeptide (TPR) repeat protein